MSGNLKHEKTINQVAHMVSYGNQPRPLEQKSLRVGGGDRLLACSLWPSLSLKWVP